jgi:hypothetical protein
MADYAYSEKIAGYFLSENTMVSKIGSQIYEPTKNTKDVGEDYIVQRYGSRALSILKDQAKKSGTRLKIYNSFLNAPTNMRIKKDPIEILLAEIHIPQAGRRIGGWPLRTNVVLPPFTEDVIELTELDSEGNLQTIQTTVTKVSWPNMDPNGALVFDGKPSPIYMRNNYSTVPGDKATIFAFANASVTLIDQVDTTLIAATNMWLTEAATDKAMGGGTYSGQMFRTATAVRMRIGGLIPDKTLCTGEACGVVHGVEDELVTKRRKELMNKAFKSDSTNLSKLFPKRQIRNIILPMFNRKNNTPDGDMASQVTSSSSSGSGTPFRQKKGETYFSDMLLANEIYILVHRFVQGKITEQQLTNALVVRQCLFLSHGSNKFEASDAKKLFIKQRTIAVSSAAINYLMQSIMQSYVPIPAHLDLENKLNVSLFGVHIAHGELNQMIRFLMDVANDESESRRYFAYSDNLYCISFETKTPPKIDGCIIKSTSVVYIKSIDGIQYESQHTYDSISHMYTSMFNGARNEEQYQVSPTWKTVAGIISRYYFEQSTTCIDQMQFKTPGLASGQPETSDCNNTLSCGCICHLSALGNPDPESKKFGKLMNDWHAYFTLENVGILNFEDVLVETVPDDTTESPREMPLYAFLAESRQQLKWDFLGFDLYFLDMDHFNEMCDNYAAANPGTSEDKPNWLLKFADAVEYQKDLYPKIYNETTENPIIVIPVLDKKRLGAAFVYSKILAEYGSDSLLVGSGDSETAVKMITKVYSLFLLGCWSNPLLWFALILLWNRLVKSLKDEEGNDKVSIDFGQEMGSVFGLGVGSLENLSPAFLIDTMVLPSMGAKNKKRATNKQKAQSKKFLEMQMKLTRLQSESILKKQGSAQSIAKSAVKKSERAPVSIENIEMFQKRGERIGKRAYRPRVFDVRSTDTIPKHQVIGRRLESLMPEALFTPGGKLKVIKRLAKKAPIEANSWADEADNDDAYRAQMLMDEFQFIDELPGTVEVERVLAEKEAGPAFKPSKVFIPSGAHKDRLSRQPKDDVYNSDTHFGSGPRWAPLKFPTDDSTTKDLTQTQVSHNLEEVDRLVDEFEGKTNRRKASQNVEERSLVNRLTPQQLQGLGISVQGMFGANASSTSKAITRARELVVEQVKRAKDRASGIDVTKRKIGKETLEIPGNNVYTNFVQLGLIAKDAKPIRVDKGSRPP